MSESPVAHNAAGPLSGSHLADLGAAKDAARRIRRAVAVSQVSAWSTGILACLTLLGAIFGDMTSLVLGAALLVIAIREGRLGGRLGSFDAAAPRALAINQLMLGAVIVAYALWSAWGAWHSNPLSTGAEATGDARVDAMLADVGSTVKLITVGVYLTVGVGGVLATGLTALFYARRAPMVREFLSTQQGWVVQTLRAAA